VDKEELLLAQQLIDDLEIGERKCLKEGSSEKLVGKNIANLKQER
jgi:hypothetical protein